MKKLAPEYGEKASWFLPPESDEEITKWENENNISIPETYKEWLAFSSEVNILNTIAHFYPPCKFRINSKLISDDLDKIFVPQNLMDVL